MHFLQNRAVQIGAVLLVVASLLYRIEEHHYHQASTHERSEVGGNWKEDGVSVAVVWPDHEDLSFVEGVTLAWEELNASSSPFSRKIRLRVFEESEKAPGTVATNVASYGDVVAVMGHELSAGVIPASVTYETRGMLFIVPVFSAAQLTGHGFQYVFRVTPDDHALARAMSEFAMWSGYTRVGLLYQRNLQGTSAAGHLKEELTEDGIEVAFFRSFREADDWSSQDFRPMIAELRNEEFDALVLSGQLPHTAKLIVDLQKMGVTQPMLATDDFDSTELFRNAGAASNGMFVASSVDPDSQAPAYLSFKERFTKRFGGPPGYAATQGYEAFRLFVRACEISQDAAPVVVATTLRTHTFTGMFGEFTFDVEGDMRGRPVTIKRHQNGSFTTVRREVE